MEIDSPLLVRDIFLNPGDYYFGTREYRFRTLLGSCVALILWHPTRLIGGMAHIILPTRKILSNSTIISVSNSQTKSQSAILSQESEALGKYADESFEQFKKSAKSFRTEISEYHAKIFGGADMFAFAKKTDKIYVSDEEKEILSNYEDKFSIGKKNIVFIRNLLEENKIPIVGQDLGGNQHRKVFLTIWDGEVWMENKKIEI
ncbi:chemotaxis protein CheD [Leptospira sp. GIMC2001]|uniref:chemotaxis protein CheD n=1 Tax=Leptospira sp. GIMC2001 TaxID=1513297 RepID=UPI0023493F20|nr:chemotaxis protein CheD [Leptospira sp. GIMC2001]WCL47846.1 chemotaxis protein CheD [Leptospira sp. GIMC2001]